MFFNQFKACIIIWVQASHFIANLDGKYYRLEKSIITNSSSQLIAFFFCNFGHHIIFAGVFLTWFSFCFYYIALIAEILFKSVIFSFHVVSLNYSFNISFLLMKKILILMLKNSNDVENKNGICIIELSTLTCDADSNIGSCKISRCKCIEISPRSSSGNSFRICKWMKMK